MIVKMSKVIVVARKADRDRLLEALRDLGAVHIAPVDPARAVADEKTVHTIADLDRAMQMLASVEPTGEAPAVSPVEAAGEVMRIHRDSIERRARLAALHRQIEQLALWGEVRLEQFAQLRSAGIDVRFYALRTADLEKIRGECIAVVGESSGRKVLVAVVDRTGEFQPPESATPVELPARDRPSIRAEAAEIDAASKADTRRLARLAHRVASMRSERNKLAQNAQYTVAMRSALVQPELYAVQGWTPAGDAPTLAGRLAAKGIDAVVEGTIPAEGEQPPTLIRYPRWAKPTEGLFKILGTIPGYTEFDVSSAFMIALPIFAAMIISDTGYGLIYLLLPALFYRKMAAKVGPELGQLVMTIGATSILWGLVTASFFGFDISGALGLVPGIGRLFENGPLITVNLDEVNMDRLMRISFILGAIHLSSAHLWKGKANFPHLKFLGNVGWAVFLWGMYGLVTMFMLKSPFHWHTPYPYLLIVGGSLAILFADPQRNVFKAFGLGLANFPLSAVGTFSDTVSYVRLMAIGVAGSVLAIAFNDMGKALPVFGRIPVMMVGHAMNVALSIVSLFAHGVRLNMLEFSNNLGMTWSGYPYKPFSKERIEET